MLTPPQAIVSTGFKEDAPTAPLLVLSSPATQWFAAGLELRCYRAVFLWVCSLLWVMPVQGARYAQHSCFRDIATSSSHCWPWEGGVHGPHKPTRCPAGCMNAPLTAPLCILPVISVNHPLDYEQVANGVIYLTVMAKDAGNPPLNSTVPVTIEVFVSTILPWFP